MKNLLWIAILTTVMYSCTNDTTETRKTSEAPITQAEKGSDKIQVLNFATFHMGTTSDAETIEFDEENKKNQEDAQKIAEMVSAFKPTVICVELPPESNAELNDEYRTYLSNPEKASTYYGEIGLVAFEVGRLNGIDKIFGIDHQMDYNYNINEDMVNTLDSTTTNTFYSDPFALIPGLNVFEEGLSLEEKLSRMNHPDFLDFLITYNADILTFVGSENGFEGADEAAKYYHRNPV